MATIIDEIQCEIAEAKHDQRDKTAHLNGFENFGDWTAAVTLTLTVNDNAGLSQNGVPLSYIDPRKLASTSFAFNASPILYQTRTRTYS